MRADVSAVTGDNDRTGDAPATATLPFAKRFGHAFLGSTATILVLTVISLQEILLGMHAYVAVAVEFLNRLHLDLVAEDVTATLDASIEIAVAAIAAWAAVMAAGIALLIAAFIRRGGPLTFLLLGLLFPIAAVSLLQAA